MKLKKYSLFIIFFLSSGLGISTHGSALASPSNTSFDQESLSRHTPTSGNAEGFKDLGNSFCFFAEGEKQDRNISDFEIKDKALYEATKNRKVMVFGGGHLNHQQAFDLSKKYARKGQIDLMFNMGNHLHEGHTVINKDPDTLPDHIEDFTSSGLIRRLGLERQFDFVVFENIRVGLTFDFAALNNAWEALVPGGKIIMYPVGTALFPYQLVMSSMFEKFTHTSEMQGDKPHYKDLFTQRIFPCHALTAIKPKPGL